MWGLGDIPGGVFWSRASAVSADGSIVVGRGSSSLGAEAFIWSEVDGMNGLGDLGGGPLDTADYGSPFLSIAVDVSADGSTVVGTAASTLPDGARRPEAFVWTARDGMRSIRDILTAEGIDLTGWTLDVATSISADGRTIVGTGTRPNERTKEAWLARLPAPETPVEIDINPGSEPNRINLRSRGVLPVAILGSDDFDVADIDVSTLAFGPGEAPPAHRKGGHSEDVNGDDLLDLVSHYRTQEAGIAWGDTEACVTAETVGGAPVRGCDTIEVLPLCGIGFELVFVLPPLMWAKRRRARG
jgi:probable HAF family extracellular repeat protein